MVNLPAGFEQGVLPLRDVPCKKKFYKSLTATEIKGATGPGIELKPEVFLKIIEFGDVCFAVRCGGQNQPVWFEPAVVIPLETFVHIEN